MLYQSMSLLNPDLEMSKSTTWCVLYIVRGASPEDWCILGSEQTEQFAECFRRMVYHSEWEFQGMGWLVGNWQRRLPEDPDDQSSIYAGGSDHDEDEDESEDGS